MRADGVGRQADGRARDAGQRADPPAQHTVTARPGRAGTRRCQDLPGAAGSVTAQCLWAQSRRSRLTQTAAGPAGARMWALPVALREVAPGPSVRPAPGPVPLRRPRLSPARHLSVVMAAHAAPARTPSIADDEYQRLVKLISAQGYDVSKIEKVPQRWN